MAITASNPRQSADVKIGGDLVVGGDLAVPAGQTWRVNGNVKIEDGAALRIEDGATLALTGIATDLAAGSGQQRRRITVGDAVRYLAGSDGGQQMRAQIEQYELETEPTDAKRQNLERLRRAAFDAEPTDADRQRLERLKAEADRFMLVSPEEAERLRAQIDHPFLLSPDEAKRAAAQFTSLMAPTAFEGYAAELMRPPEAAAIMAGLAEYERPPRWLLQMEEYRSSWAEAIRKAVEPAVLNVALAANAAALESMHQALNPMAVNMMNDAIELMREPGKQVMAAMELMREPSKQAMAAINSLTWPQQTTIDAMSDLDRVRSTLRNSGYSLGLLDDTDRAIDRLHERRRAPPARRPEPPEERVQGLRLTQALALVEIERRQPEPEAERQNPYAHLDYALQKGVWRPVGVLEKLLQYGDVRACIAEMLEGKPGPRQDDGNYPEEKVKEMWLAWLIADPKKRKELLEEWNISPDAKYHYKLFRKYKLPLRGKKDTN